jgi:hypothetical protein
VPTNWGGICEPLGLRGTLQFMLPLLPLPPPLPLPLLLLLLLLMSM